MRLSHHTPWPSAKHRVPNVISKLISRIRTINSALLLLVSICVVPAFFVSMAAITYYYTHVKGELVASAVRRATSISANIDATIKGIEIGLLTLSHSPSLQKVDLPAFQQQAEQTLRHFGIAQNIYLMTPDGRQLINTSLPYGTRLPATSNLDLLRRVVQQRSLVVSDVYLGSITRAPLVAVVVPVFADGKVAYVLGASITPTGMSQVLVNSQPPTDWIISAHDSKTTFLARTRNLASLVGKPASDDMQAAMAIRPAGTLEGDTREGIPVFAAYTQSKFTGWTVSVGIPKAKLLTNLNNVILAAILLTAAAVAIGAMAAMALAVHIRTAITALVPPAEALSRSEAVVLPPETFAETHAVALALERTSVRLRQSEYEAQHDELTGLVNRSFLKAALPNYVRLCERNHTSMAFLSIDLDGFKAVNDQYGHPAGDDVLCASAQRIVAARRGADVSVRLGGDEFALIMYDSTRSGAHQAATQLLHALSRPIDTQFGTLTVSASIGIALYPDDASDIEALLLKADAALYHAKRSGKNCVAFASAA